MFSLMTKWPVETKLQFTAVHNVQAFNWNLSAIRNCEQTLSNCKVIKEFFTFSCNNVCCWVLTTSQICTIQNIRRSQSSWVGKQIQCHRTAKFSSWKKETFIVSVGRVERNTKQKG